MTLRETSKARRRDAILAAAKELLTMSAEQFSMRKLAELADVSLATPYNLFGSKHAIVAALMNADSARLENTLDRFEGGALGALLKAPAYMRAGYARQPDYYRNIISTAYQSGGRETRINVGMAPVLIWKKLVAQAIANGDLLPDIDTDAFAMTYGELTLAHILVWAQGFISLEAMEARMNFGVALILNGVATDAGRQRLTPIRQDAETALQKAWATDSAPLSSKTKKHA